MTISEVEKLIEKGENSITEFKSAIEDLLSEKYVSKHRNKLLTEVFYLTGDIEKYGTEFKRLREWLVEYPNLGLTIENLSDFIKVTIGLSSKNLNGELNDRQRLVLQKIKSTPGINAKSLSETLSIPFSTVDKYIRLFLNRRNIERRGSKKTGWYYLKEGQ